MATVAPSLRRVGRTCCSRDGATFATRPGGTNCAQSGTLVARDGGLFGAHSRSVAWPVKRLLEAGGGALDPGALSPV